MVTLISASVGAAVVGFVASVAAYARQRNKPKGSAAPCPHCDHVKAGHDSLGCTAKVRGSMGAQRCPCRAKYGEPR